MEPAGPDGNHVPLPAAGGKMEEVDQQRLFRELYQHHQSDVRAFIASVIRDWHRAEDVAQEVSIVLWRKFADYDQTRSFGAWARGVAANLIMRDLDRHRRSMPLLSPEAVAAVLDAYEAEPLPEAPSELAALRACMQRLSGHARTLVALRYDESLPLEAVAERTSSSLSAVKKALSRIRSQLHRCVSVRMAQAKEPA